MLSVVKWWCMTVARKLSVCVMVLGGEARCGALCHVVVYVPTLGELDDGMS